MTPLLSAWLELLLRWLHVMAAIAWLGMTFVVALLDRRLGRGEAWLVHGGGFYRVRRADRSPVAAARFRAAAYTSWAAGFLLLLLAYELPLVARLLGLAWLVLGYSLYEAICRWPPLGSPLGVELAMAALLALSAPLLALVMAPRAALLHTGALAGTLMVASLAHVIAPAQRRLLAGEALSKERLAAILERQRHIALLAAPTVLLMLAAHMPWLEERPVLWLATPAALLLGLAVRRLALPAQEPT
jgi:uncharacterized membrane protein